MAQNITLCGATYRAVPSVLLPKTGGGTATFVELSDQNGKVVKDGQLIEQGARAIFANGTYDTTEYGEVQVSVSNKEKAILDGSISGAYTNAGVKSLRPYALYKCPSIGELHLPKCLTVGEYAVALTSEDQYSSALTEVDLPLAETIAKHGFTYHRALETAYIPNVETAETYAFAYCSALETLDAHSLNTIGTYAFYNCNALSDAQFGALTAIPTYALGFCNSLHEDDVPFNSIETISTNGCRECNSFVSIVAPKLKEIGQYAFYNCTNLERVDLGGGLTEEPSVGIGALAFSGCKKNNHFVIRYTGGVYPLAGNSAFGSTNSTPLAPTGAGYFYFPRALVSDYKAATNWKAWSNKDTRFRCLEDYTVDGTVTGALDESKI